MHRSENEKRIKQALDEYKLEEQERKEREYHLKEYAIGDELARQEKKKKEIEDAKKQWQAEQAKKQKDADDAKKKKDEEIEQEIRRRMAKYGFHNKGIEGTIEGKNEHYCHKHHKSYLCEICEEIYVKVTPCGRKVLVRRYRY